MTGQLALRAKGLENCSVFCDYSWMSPNVICIIFYSQKQVTRCSLPSKGEEGEKILASAFEGGGVKEFVGIF